jgi:hypothetical protein
MFWSAGWSHLRAEGSVLDPNPDWIRIQSGQWIRIRNPDPDPEGQKLTHKNKKKLRNFIFWSAGCSLLRAEGFSCSLDVLYGGLERSK